MQNQGFYNRNKFNKFGGKKNEYPTRINFNIKVPQVRVVQDGKQLGIMRTDDARRIAQEAGLDLVEIVPNAQPPVCEIKDYGKWKFEEKIKQKESARKQRESQIQMKEIRLRPGIAGHDVETKVTQARKFIEEGKVVQLNLQFRGHRELSHKEQGFAVINKIIAELAGVSAVEKAPKMEGNRITCRLTPKE